MTDLDFGKLEIKLYHNPTTMSNLKSLDSFIDDERLDYVVSKDTEVVNTFTSDKQFEFSFENTQLACDFEIIDSIESSADSCKLTVWNIRENTIITLNDVFIFRYYWESNPNKSSMYIVRVQEAETSIDNADMKTVVNGTMLDESLIYDTKINNLYPKISTYLQVKEILTDIYKLNFLTVEKIFDSSMALPEPLFTKDKSLGEILDNVCDQIGFKWKISKDSIAIYNPEKELLDGVFKIPVLTIDYNDVFKYALKDDGVEIQTGGIPGIVAGQVVYLDTSNTPPYVTEESKYYIVDEIKTEITNQSGFFSSLFMHEVVNNESNN